MLKNFKFLISNFESIFKSKFLKIFILIIAFSCILYTLYLPPVHADELDDLQKQIDQLNHDRELSVNATKPLEGQLGALQLQLAQIQANLQTLTANIKQKQQDLNVREDKLALQQALLEARVRAYYIRSFSDSPLLIIFSSVQSGDFFRELSYRQAATKEDQQIITSITGEMVDLLTQKNQLEKDSAKLASLQTQVDKNAQFFSGEIAKAKDYQSKLSSQIADLSARQQQIIAERQASLNLPTSLGGGPLYCTDDRKLSPGFSPAFAFYTFGIPHRVGMNQYGALGRAQAGQSYHDILSAYFNNISFDKRPNININVDGYGSMSLEQYLLGIYEIPGDWPMEALKAQAVASRSYALAYTDNGAKSICTSQSCQVYKGGDKGGAWDEAVRDTAGEVMTNGGQVITGWFASTAGGYTFTSADVWGNGTAWTKRTRDTNGDVNSISDLQSKAYDKDSPCFYSAQGFRSQYDNSAWLTPQEVADIANSIMLVQRDNSVATHIYQPDKPNPEGTDTWDPDRVKQELRNRGGTPFDSVSDVSMSFDFGSGMTTSVTVSGDGNSQTFNASDFRNFFNLRAPANISIVGPLFNIEKK